MLRSETDFDTLFNFNPGNSPRLCRRLGHRHPSRSCCRSYFWQTSIAFDVPVVTVGIRPDLVSAGVPTGIVPRAAAPAAAKATMRTNV